MKRILNFAICLLIYSFIFPQGFVNNGAEISVKKGALLSICGHDGNYINLNDGLHDGSILLEGNIEIKGNWINNSASNVFKGNLTDGNIIFSGPDEQKILAPHYADFENIIIDKTNQLKICAPKCFVFGNLIINKGAFNADSNIIILHKNWENYDTFLTNNSIIVFNGNDHQKIIPSNSPLDNIIFNNSFTGNYDIEICQNLLINHYAQFLNGVVYSNNNSQVVFNNNASSNGGSPYSFINNVVVKKGEDEFIFPIGKVDNSDLIWAPLKISQRHLNDIFTCEYFYKPSPNNSNPLYMMFPVTATSKVEYWSLKRIFGNSTPYVCLFSNDNIRSDILIPDSIIIADFDSTQMKWQSLGGTYTLLSSNSGNILSAMPYTTNTILTFANKSSIPLPIDILRFKVECFGNFVEISWTTASEINNDFFILEKSFDLVNWEFVSKIYSMNNCCSNINTYNVKDEEIISDLHYYRLKQIDYDGNENVYLPIPVKCNEQFDIIVYPNPCKDYINIRFNN
ncbi:MAG TPA: hypothetical protein P5250_04830, partial [Bacteroidales bacterium]|nr:hypothetical protein [Bacteroidales bacterium]